MLLVLAAAIIACAAPRFSFASEESVDRVTKLALDLDIQRDAGARLFADNCARCHGADAHGKAAESIPSLAGQRFRYLVRQLADFAGDQRESREMHRVLAQSAVKPPQSWVNIAGYLNSLPAAREPMTGSGANAALGRGIFHEQCASCHGQDAHGDREGFVPSLRNQHYSYLAAQMPKLAQGRRHNVDEDLVRFLRTFGLREVDGLADYLSRLSGPVHRRRIMRNDGSVVD